MNKIIYILILIILLLIIGCSNIDIPPTQQNNNPQYPPQYPQQPIGGGCGV